MKLTKVASAGGVTLAVLAVAGCGSATGIAHTSGAALTRQNFAAAMSAAATRSQSVHLSGTFVIQGKTVRLSADAGTRGTSLKDDAMSMVMQVPSMGTLQMRLVGGAAYLNAGGLGLPGATSARPWLKFDLLDPHNPFGSAFARIADMGPGDLMKDFRAISSVTKVGSQTVDGVPTTHYRVTLDAAKLGALMGVPAGQGAAQLPKTLGYDIWVDSTSRPVEMKTTNTMMTEDLHFSRWGEPVHVVAPPASQVTAIGDTQT